MSSGSPDSEMDEVFTSASDLTQAFSTTATAAPVPDVAPTIGGILGSVTAAGLSGVLVYVLRAYWRSRRLARRSASIGAVATILDYLYVAFSGASGEKLDRAMVSMVETIRSNPKLVPARALLKLKKSLKDDTVDWSRERMRGSSDRYGEMRSSVAFEDRAIRRRRFARAASNLSLKSGDYTDAPVMPWMPGVFVPEHDWSTMVECLDWCVSAEYGNMPVMGRVKSKYILLLPKSLWRDEATSEIFRLLEDMLSRTNKNPRDAVVVLGGAVEEPDIPKVGWTSSSFYEIQRMLGWKGMDRYGTCIRLYTTASRAALVMGADRITDTAGTYFSRDLVQRSFKTVGWSPIYNVKKDSVHVLASNVVMPRNVIRAAAGAIWQGGASATIEALFGSWWRVVHCVTVGEMLDHEKLMISEVPVLPFVMVSLYRSLTVESMLAEIFPGATLLYVWPASYSIPDGFKSVGQNFPIYMSTRVDETVLLGPTRHPGFHVDRQSYSLPCSMSLCRKGGIFVTFPIRTDVDAVTEAFLLGAIATVVHQSCPPSADHFVDVETLHLRLFYELLFGKTARGAFGFDFSIHRIAHAVAVISAEYVATRGEHVVQMMGLAISEAILPALDYLPNTEVAGILSLRDDGDDDCEDCLVIPELADPSDLSVVPSGCGLAESISFVAGSDLYGAFPSVLPEVRIPPFDQEHLHRDRLHTSGIDAKSAPVPVAPQDEYPRFDIIEYGTALAGKPGRCSELYLRYEQPMPRDHYFMGLTGGRNIAIHLVTRSGRATVARASYAAGVTLRKYLVGGASPDVRAPILGDSLLSAVDVAADYQGNDLPVLPVLAVLPNPRHVSPAVDLERGAGVAVRTWELSVVTDADELEI